MFVNSDFRDWSIKMKIKETQYHKSGKLELVKFIYPKVSK